MQNSFYSFLEVGLDVNWVSSFPLSIWILINLNHQCVSTSASNTTNYLLFLFLITLASAYPLCLFTHSFGFLTVHDLLWPLTVPFHVLFMCNLQISLRENLRSLVNDHHLHLCGFFMSSLLTPHTQSLSHLESVCCCITCLLSPISSGQREWG